MPLHRRDPPGTSAAMASPRFEHVDLSHFEDDDGDIPPRVRKRADFYGDLVRFGTTTEVGQVRMVPVRCPRRPQRRRCPGLLVVARTESPHRVEFGCPECRAAGVVSGWEDGVADLRALESELDDTPFGLPVSAEAHAALRDVARTEPTLVPLAFEAVVDEDDGPMLLVNPAASFRLAAIVLIHARRESSRRIHERLVEIAAELTDLAGELVEADVEFDFADPETTARIGLLMEEIDAESMPDRAPGGPRVPLRLVGDGEPDLDRRTFRIKVTLQDVRPPVWRRLLVPADIALPTLHEVLQEAMGWTDSHLHMFVAGDRCFAPHGDREAIGEDSREVRLVDLAPGQGARLLYEYDFGDGWTHDILVESVVDEPCARVRCIKGRRRCPPEDCGGPWGYGQLLAARVDPGHERHEQLAAWVGSDFDPEEFDAATVNERLGRMMNGR